MIDQLQAFALMGAFSCGMTRQEVETEFKIGTEGLDNDDVEKLHNIGKIINHTRAIEAASLVEKLCAHFERDEAVTLAAAILSKKS